MIHVRKRKQNKDKNKIQCIGGRLCHDVNTFSRDLTEVREGIMWLLEKAHSRNSKTKAVRKGLLQHD